MFYYPQILFLVLSEVRNWSKVGSARESGEEYASAFFGSQNFRNLSHVPCSPDNPRLRTSFVSSTRTYNPNMLERDKTTIYI